MKEYSPEEMEMFEKLADQYDTFRTTLKTALNGKPENAYKQVLLMKDHSPYLGFKNLQEMRETVKLTREKGIIVEAKSCTDAAAYYQFEITERKG